jgi:3-hydroxymyristoyl/3-hydroxydecanoyl-(acyl carrier protein) dehydratase
LTALYQQRDAMAATFLPVGSMLQLDRVLAVDGEQITAEMDVNADHWVFPMHFPGDPVFPGCLLIEAAGQLVALWGWEAGLRGRPRMARASAEFENALLPEDERVELRARVRRRRNMCFGTVEIQAGGRMLATVELVIVVVGLPA